MTGAPIRNGIALTSFGDLFAPCEVLSPEARRRLAALVVVGPGEAPPLFPAALATAGLPRRRDGLVAMRTEVEAGLGPQALASLADVLLGVVVPAIEGRRDEVRARSGRLRSLLEANEATTWDALARLRVGEVAAWAGMGPIQLVALIGLAVEAALGMVGAEPEDDTVEHEVDDLTLLVEHDQRVGSGELHIAIERCGGTDQPAAVRAAAARLLARAPAPCHRAVSSLDAVLAAVGDERDRGVFAHLVLSLDCPPRASEVGEALGIGFERVRQLRVRAEERATAAVRDEAEVSEVVRSVADGLGIAAPADAVADVLVTTGLPVLPDTRSLLVLWLAGPFRPVTGHEGWLATDRAGLVAETRRLLGEDGGVRLQDQVAKELGVLGVAPAHVAAWIARQPVRTVDGLLVLTTGSTAEVAERALFASGRASTVQELVATAWPGPEGPGVEEVGEVLRRDRRFLQVSETDFELAEWGGEPHPVRSYRARP